MSYNGAGVFSLYTPGNPVVTGTTISSTWANNTLSDIATGLSTCLLKNGTQTVTANIPFSNFRLTGLGAATARTDAIQYAQVQDGISTALTSVSGTNTITASAPASLAAYATGQKFWFVPAATNTGATTININSISAKNIFANGAACVGGELVISVPTEVYYDGTQFNIIGSLFPRFKVVSFQRDVSTASGNQSVTGVGFKPKGAIFLMGISGNAARASFGVDDGTTSGGVYANAGSTLGQFNVNAVSIYANTTDGTTAYSGSVTTWDDDGFTIAWTKFGSPTGTITVKALLFR